MKLEKNYLSDKELDQFILNIEENELVKAPPDILDKVISQIETISKKDIINGNDEKIEAQKELENRAIQNKAKEFRAYCFRVITSVAAAIIFVFLLPQLFTTEQFNLLEEQKILSEIYQTKENRFNDTNILSQLLGEKNIFNNENK